MKRTGFLLLVLTFVFLQFGCEKVIDVDLNSNNPQFVIEGTIVKDDTIQRVRITKTLNFDEVTSFPGVDNATLTVIDNLGNSGVFLSVGNGEYVLPNYPGIEGRTYTLSVDIEGNQFQASSTMPTFVPIDSLLVSIFPFGQDTFRTVVPARFDPAGIKNYYQFHLFDSGVYQSGVYLQDDQFSDGNYDVQPLFGESFEPGDLVTVEMFCIDKPVWSYFNQLSVNTNGSGATPANPTSNFSGGCLGYFSARTKSVKSVMITE